MTIDKAGLADHKTIANVAFDLFADRNPASAQNETAAETEIMLWLGTFGNPHPLGFYGLERTCHSATVSDVEL